MIIGHLGIALGARAVDRDAPLPWLVAAAVAPDVLDILLASRGVCNAMGEYTHTLPAIAVTAVVLGVAAGWTDRRWRTGLMVAALVVSHILVDYVTGLKPLWIGGPIVGLNLYRWPWVDFLIEAPLIAGGWWAARRWGNVPRWVGSRLMLVALLLAQVGGDATKHGGDTDQEGLCAKAFLIKDLEHIF